MIRSQIERPFLFYNHLIIRTPLSPDEIFEALVEVVYLDKKRFFIARRVQHEKEYQGWITDKGFRLRRIRSSLLGRYQDKEVIHGRFRKHLYGTRMTIRVGGGIYAVVLSNAILPYFFALFYRGLVTGSAPAYFAPFALLVVALTTIGNMTWLPKRATREIIEAIQSAEERLVGADDNRRILP